MILPNPEKASGVLVPTTAYREVFRNGVRELVSEQGLAFVPNDLPPSVDWNSLNGRLTTELLAAERSLARLDGRATLLQNPHLLIKPFMRREARVSSLIEDTIATPTEIALAESGGPVEREDPIEILNYSKALEYGLNSELPLCNRLLRQMHAVLLKGVRGERDLPGEFRREQNYIGSKTLGFNAARFVPPPAGEHMERCLNSFERFLNQPPDNMPILIAIALAHYQFECIHPFRDGNGRLGRLMMILSLCRAGILSRPYIFISEYFSRNEVEYKDLLLKVSTDGAWESWLKFVLRGFAEQATIADAQVQSLLALHRKYADLLKGKQSSALLLTLLDNLFLFPFVRIEDVNRALNITTTASRRHVETLIAKGILQPWKIKSKANWYVAREIIQTSDPQPDDPPTAS